MHGFKSAILVEWKNWQNGTFEPVHKIQFFFGRKTSYETLWKSHIRKIFIDCSRICQIQDLGQSKYKLKLFSKRTCGISKIYKNVLMLCQFAKYCNFLKAHSFFWWNQANFVRLVYSEKATKFCEIFTLLLTGTTYIG